MGANSPPSDSLPVKAHAPVSVAPFGSPPTAHGSPSLPLQTSVGLPDPSTSYSTPPISLQSVGSPVAIGVPTTDLPAVPGEPLVPLEPFEPAAPVSPLAPGAPFAPLAPLAPGLPAYFLAIFSTSFFCLPVRAFEAA